MGGICYSYGMKRCFRTAAVALPALLLLPPGMVGCTQQQVDPLHLFRSEPAVSNEGLNMRPYRVRGKWYRPMGAREALKYTETGMASHYSSGRHHRRHGALYAAHKTLPMPCVVRVTNLTNGRSCICPVVDRGPFIRGRIIDLSRGAASQIGMLGAGVAPVKVEVVSVGKSPQ